MFCERVRATLRQLEKDYKGQIKIAFRHYVVHPGTADIPARAACAAGRQGKFRKMMDRIFDHGFLAGRNLSQANMIKQARRLKLNRKKFLADMRGPCVQVVQNDQRQLAKFGVRGTPSFFINGRFLSGAQPINRFKTVIDEELRKAKQRIRGTKKQRRALLRSYYQTWVVTKGKPRL